MYCSKQEEFIFDIILFILVVFQVVTFFTVKSGEYSLRFAMILICINVVLLSAMIPYAKWVWKTPSYNNAFLTVAKHELLFLGLSVLAMIAVTFR
jgi:hypothetical protein